MAAVSGHVGSRKRKGVVNGASTSRTRDGARDGRAAHSRARKECARACEESSGGHRNAARELSGAGIGIESASGNVEAILSNRVVAGDGYGPKHDERQGGRDISRSHEGACSRFATQLLSAPSPQIEAWQVLRFAAAAILLLNIVGWLASVAGAR